MVKLSSGGELQKVSAQTTPIQIYSTALWETLTERETAVIYKQALSKTWMLLKQAIALLFFLLLFAIALIFSIWGIGFALGAALGQDPDKMQQDLITQLQSSLQRLVGWADDYVKRYLPGWQSSNTQR
ncbi:hypothetical protein H6F51_14125 [Cyanobacteria bacterium FACHB-DQ100]|nr:hypothetical protein [Cyanobacteria bacterium FACHB-DQ100]